MALTSSPKAEDEQGEELATKAATAALQRTTSSSYGEISKVLFPGPPRLVRDWMKNSRRTLYNTTPQQGNRGRLSRFPSGHHNGYVYPIYDVLANEILLWLLPTHMFTHLIKFTIVLLLLLCGFLFGTWYPSSDYSANLIVENGTMTLWELVRYNYWPHAIATMCLLAIPVWISWYYQRTLYALGKPWMDPRLPAVNRLDMHVPLRLYCSVDAARQGACHVEWVSRTTPIQQQQPKTKSSSSLSSSVVAPNVWNINGLDWKFRLLPTVEQALSVVYQDESLVEIDLGASLSTRLINNLDKDDDDRWSDMVIPSNWMFRNGQVPFDKPIYTNQKYPFPCMPPVVPRNNPTGVYRTVISLPDDWMAMDAKDNAATIGGHDDSEDEDASLVSNVPLREDDDEDSHLHDATTATYSLILHGIESACFVYWDGEMIGFCKDSRLPSEFVIPWHLITGSARGKGQPQSARFQHVLHLVVIRWSDGSYVEDQDHWWTAGVHRSIELIRRPANADILDFNVVQATSDGQLAVEVVTRKTTSSKQRNIQEQARLTRLQRPNERSITLRLFQDEQIVSSSNCDDGSSGDGRNSTCSVWKPAKSEIWSETQTIPLDENHVTSLRKSHGDGNDDNGFQDVDSKVMLRFSTSVDKPLLWTAETPNLYTLVVEQQIHLSYDSDDDRDSSETNPTSITVQAESCRIGFRSVEITEGVLKVNGKRITVCGINHHDHDPDHGKVVSLERMQKDIMVLKQNNFNAIRTSHYPHDTTFYRLCDYFGMYVCDEANIESHGMKPLGRLVQDWGWENTFVSRVRRMVQRDFNHPCIIFWSLGNEAGRGPNLSLARQLVLDLDDTRPICYESGCSWFEGLGRSELTDIVCPMYPNVTSTVSMAQRTDDDRPLILCEYSHSMNNSNGNLHLYWEAFWDPRTPRLQGGFIWDMIDQGLRKRTEEGREYFAYGGDFGDVINDAEFCINGMFTPEREPHPAVAEIKYLQQPVDIACVQLGDKGEICLEVSKSSISPITLLVRNKYVFRDLSHITWKWHISSSLSTEHILEGTSGNVEGLSQLEVATAFERILMIEKSRTSDFNIRYFLNIRGVLTKSQSWAEAGHELVTKQFPIRFKFSNPQPASPVADSDGQDYGPLQIGGDDKHITILRDNKIPMVTIARETGSIISIDWNGHSVLCGGSGLRPNYTRAATNNDKGGVELILEQMNLGFITSWYRLRHGLADFSYELVWKRLGLSQDNPPKLVCDSVKAEGSGDRVIIKATCRIMSRHNSTLFGQVMTYDICRNGAICVSCKAIPTQSVQIIPSLPRVGLNFLLDPSLCHVRYFGCGPGENYPDRKSGCWTGIWESRPSEMGYDYIVPAENGCRSDCEWVAFRNDDGAREKRGAGILVVAPPGNTFSFSSLLHSSDELHQASHTCDLEVRRDGTHPVHVSIDHKLMGLGGDVSWFPRVYADFVVKPKEYSYSHWLLPLSEHDDAPLVARRLMPKSSST